MRPAILLLVFLSSIPIPSNAQGPVLIGGGSAPPTPVMPAEVLPAPTFSQPVAPCTYPSVGVQIVSGGYYNAPNVIYFGGANSRYHRSYPPNCYVPSYSYSSPSVIYFGRGEACERGYAFRRHR